VATAIERGDEQQDGSMRLPSSIGEVTSKWLTFALSQAAPGLVVRSAKLVDYIHGASTKARMGVSTNRNDFPSTIIVKAGFEPHSQMLQGMHLTETHAYRDLIPTLDVNAPRCLFAGEDTRGEALVILEDLDLRQARFLTLQHPLDFELAARFLDGLARFHARWWDAPDIAARFPWAADTHAMSRSHYFDILLDPARFADYATFPRGAAMPKTILHPERIARGHAVLADLHAAMPHTMLHGDAHLGNLYIDADGTPAFLDWQPRRGPWVLDVTYFMTASLDVVDRRRWEAALLQHYLTRLASYGVAPPGFDEAFDAYRRDVIWGLLIWMLNGSEFQTESNNTASATRFAMAMIDHETFARLGV
jgi:hypothetical protein